MLLVEYFHHCNTKIKNSDSGLFSKVRTGWPDHSRNSHFAIGQEHSSWALCTSRGWHFFSFKMDLRYNTIYIYIYIFFSEQSKEGCHVANGKPLCGASPGEDWPYYWRSSTGWACYCMFKQSVSKKSFPCTDSDFIVKQIRSAENKARVKWLTAKCYPYLSITAH